MRLYITYHCYATKKFRGFIFSFDTDPAIVRDGDFLYLEIRLGFIGFWAIFSKTKRT